MVESFEPIKPCEPILPEHTPIEVVPGPDPTRPPLIEPSSDPLKPEDIPPTPTDDPEAEPSGGDDGNKPPTPPTTVWPPDDDNSDDDNSDDDNSDDDNSDTDPETEGNGEKLQPDRLGVAQCVFQPVDSISQYNSFRSGTTRRHRGRPFGIDISLDGYSCYVATLRAVHPGHHEDDYRKAAWNFIWNHQRFHYRVDCAVSALEGAFDVAGKRLGSNIWQQFHILVGGSPNRCSALEESLSCAFALRQCKDQLSRNLTLTLVRKQPKAYQQQTDDGQHILTAGNNQRYQDATSQLLSRYLDLKLRSPDYAANLHLLLSYTNPFGLPLKLPYLTR